MRVLVTGATGVIGTEVAQRLRALPGAQVTATARRAPAGDTVAWHIGQEPPLPPLEGPWDVIVHTAASTRWTMSRDEALDANVGVLRAILGLAGPGTHLVHLSTAYVGGQRNRSDLRGEEFEGYRNGYEWSKAVCEQVILEEHRGPTTIVRPPLVVGRRTDGRIARFTGPYTIFSTMVSGLAPAVVGDPDGYTEISPVDDVADVVAATVLGGPPAEPRTEVIAGGRQSLRLSEMIDTTCRTVNKFRAEHGVAPIGVPPIVSIDSWDRFFLPLSRNWLSPTQQQVVDLLGMFYSYTSMTVPFEPTYPVRDAASVLATTVWHWAGSNPRQALAEPKPWRLPATS
jgi:nucleoside-diphosphate-sugar epimerase